MSDSTTAALQATDHQPAPIAPKSRSPRATKATSRHPAEKPRKVSFYLSPDAIRRLGVAASMTDSDKSKVLEGVIREAPALRRFVVQDRSGQSALPSQDLSAA